MLEEVLVTGIRASLERSMDIKRDSTGVVDAISAEDIGKFPDTNLAESLQRITGVSIDRRDGEGSRVTVRGFGPDQNLITLNNRQLPTTTGGRSFEFANIAAESVTGVQAYKTADATVTSGGMGATINLSTHRPLDNPGLRLAGSAKVVHDESARTGGTTPELSGLFSNTFMDDRLGVSISGSYQERESGSREFLADQGYRAWDLGFDGWGGAPQAPAGGANRPSPDEHSGIYSVPQQPRYVFQDRERTRINGQAVIQFEPTDDITITADYVYIHNNYEIQHNDVSAWFNYSDDRSDTIWDGDDRGIFWPTVYSEIYPEATRDTSLTVGSYGSDEEINSFGLNVEWRVNDQLTLEFDHHTSDGERKASDPNRGTANNMQLPSYTRGRTALDLTGSLPGIGIHPDEVAAFQPDTFQLSGSWFQNHHWISDVSQTQLRGNFEFDDSMSIDFGASLNTVENTNRFVQVERPDWEGVGEPGDFSGFDWTETSIVDKIGGTPGNFAGLDYAVLDRMWYANFDEIVLAAELADPDANTTNNIFGDCQAAPGAVSGPGGAGQFCPSTNYDLGDNNYTEEETTAVYARFNYSGDLAGKSYDFHAGLRYETTDVYSSSSAANYTDVVWTEATQAALDGDGSTTTLEQSASYSNVLPSVNFNLDVSDDVILRLAAGKTIARHGFGSLRGGTSAGGAGTRGGFTANSGNPGLKPLESTNFDMSVEWYYDDVSYVSIGAFRKDVSNWVSTQLQERVIYEGLPNVFEGPRFNDAIAALGSSASNEHIRQWIFENRADHPDVDVATQTIRGTQGEDPDVVFNDLVPVNSDVKRTVSGYEFNIQHMFGHTGFGAIANYTVVDADISYDDTRIGDTPALPGLSDTANLVAFYDDRGLQVRLAYNWRSRFLNERRVGGDGLTAGVYTAPYHQLDLSASYDIPAFDGLTVFFEGINITDERVETHGRHEDLIYRITETGPRYALGVRYSF
ncbi:TonB-dependent receptor [Marinimicrobium sp. ABcell2]|uniref:TonB-dependent receptor n=1 Tax=Marinimicrobium sp. ABcell2 TaxID=3069751 RepID=UPI0027AFEF8B|nr:TonB-dependent receptor [Marinimicrobium sp. ABcell2]MDQ2075956.1 TonB-dependent receptor [Marinimicrobium sp. ABcell2]